MVAKVPKVKGTMKKIPLMRVVTKTSLKKKNKIASVAKEASFKDAKKKVKKLKKKKKKAAAKSTLEKATKPELNGKKTKVLKKKPKMKKEISSSLVNEEIISEDKERESNTEIKPGESEANEADLSIPAEQCVIHQLPDFSTDNRKEVEKETAEGLKKNLKKKKGKKNKKKKKKPNCIESGSASHSVNEGDAEIKLGSTLQGNSSLNSDELEGSAPVKGKKGKKALGLKTKSKKTGAIKNKTIKKGKKQNKIKKKKQATDDNEKSKDSSSEAIVKPAFEDLPALSFVIDTEKGDKVEDDQRVIEYTTVDALVVDKQKQRERELTDDLFGGMKIDEEIDSEDDYDEDLNFPSARKDRSRKRDREPDVPEDPFDIHETEVSPAKKRPAWVDEEDENVKVKDVVGNMVRSRGKRGEREVSEKKYESELREKFSNIVGGTPEWADLEKIPKDLDEDDMGRKTGNYLSGKSSVDLPRRTIEYKKMYDINSSHTEGPVIRSIEFNENLRVAIVAGSVGPLGAVSIFQVDGIHNHRIHSVRFPNFPISCARFLKDGKRFVVGSFVHCHFFVYDMETSKETRLFVNQKMDRSVDKNLYVNPDGETFLYLDNKGKLFVYDTETLSLIDIMESPFPVTAATFNSDGTRLYTYGLTGEVCVWDMNERQCIHKFVDEGCIAGDAIALSPNNQYLACGSCSGIVNIYDASMLSTVEPAPVKVLSNLTTPITELRFNSTSEVLAMASDRKLNAVKLVHFPSMTVFENFPNLGKEMKSIVSVSFSPNSGYFAMGNDRGAAALYRLKHFPNY